MRRSSSWHAQDDGRADSVPLLRQTSFDRAGPSAPARMADQHHNSKEKQFSVEAGVLQNGSSHSSINISPTSGGKAKVPWWSWIWDYEVGRSNEETRFVQRLDIGVLTILSLGTLPDTRMTEYDVHCPRDCVFSLIYYCNVVRLWTIYAPERSICSPTSSSCDIVSLWYIDHQDRTAIRKQLEPSRNVYGLSCRPVPKSRTLITYVTSADFYPAQFRLLHQEPRPDQHKQRLRFRVSHFLISTYFEV